MILKRKSKIALLAAMTLTALLPACRKKTEEEAPQVQEADQVQEEAPEEEEKAPRQDLLLNLASQLVCQTTGMQESGFGHYDEKTGIYHSCIEENGPYIQALSFLNGLYRNRLLLPDDTLQNQAPDSENPLAGIIREDSLNAIHAESDKEFKKAVLQLQTDAKNHEIDAYDSIELYR